MSFANLDIEDFLKRYLKLLQLVATDFGQLKEDVNRLLAYRMVDKLMVGGIVFHKHNF